VNYAKGTSKERIQFAEPKPGIYYILVQSYQGAGAYNLEIELA
jgi:hypothetical protein